MQYITHREFNSKTISGNKTFHRGALLELRDMMLYYNNEPICVARSYNGKQHFARNDDGHGLERGDITYAIAYGDRVKTWEETITTKDEETGEEKTETITQQARFTPEEVEMIETEYPEFDRDPRSGILLFSDEFFTADIEKLREFAKKLDIEV